MKFSKQIYLLQRVTAVRVRLGLTQKQLGEQIGTSRSTISMVELKVRPLPAAALARLTQLELSLKATHPTNAEIVQTLKKEDEATSTMKRLARELKQLKLNELKYEQEQMIMTAGDLTTAILNLRQLLAHTSDPNQVSRLTLALTRLTKKLQRCDEQAQAKLKGKMAKLEITLAASGPETTKDLPSTEDIAMMPAADPTMPKDIPQGHRIKSGLLKPDSKVLHWQLE